MSGDVVAVLGAAALVAAVALAWWAVGGRTALTDDGAQADVQMIALSSPTAGRLVGPMVTWLGTAVGRLTPRHRARGAQRRLDRAGLAATWTPAILLGARATSALVLGVVLLIRLALDPSGGAVLALAAAVVAGWWLPDLWLIRRGEQRRREITQAVPDTIDQLAVLVRAGLGIDAALNRCAQSEPGPLGRELARVVQELRLGSTRQHALSELVERTGADDLRAVVTALAQAEDLGVPVSDTLRLQAEEVRVRRRQRAAEHAMKLPVKILVPLVVCIFPVLLIVLLGPAVLTIADELGG